jgi:arylsulfatase A-like enzyme
MSGPRTPRSSAEVPVLRIAVVLGLTAGIVDVCVALLNKPRGFEAMAAMLPAIVATAALMIAAFALVWVVARGVVVRFGFDRRSAAIGIAAFLGTGFTVAVLVGLQAQGLTPQTVFRTAIILAVAAVIGMGAYAMSQTVRQEVVLAGYVEPLVWTLPILLFEVLVYEWTEVYAIDHVTSLTSIAASVGLLMVLAMTLALAELASARRRTRGIATVVGVAIVITAAVQMISGRKSTAIQASAGEPTPPPANIVLITVDTLRADAVSAYRPAAPPTPAIDSIAADAVLFDHAVAPAPWTLPSLTSILSGLLPAAHRTTGFTSSVSRNIRTLAEYLSAQGFYTAAIVHNDLLNPKNDLSQGFAEYRSLYEQWYANSVGAGLLQTLTPSIFPPPSWPTNDDETRIVTTWLEQNRHRRFFLWLHYFDPHAPYAPPSQYLVSEPLPAIGAAFDGPKVAMQGYFVPSRKERAAIRALYDGEVRYVDANIARVLDTLKRMKLYDSSLIVFTSDHGEEFFEHGLAGHGHSVYEELLRVPLMIKLPGSARRGRTSVPVSTASITPTILQASGIRYDAANMSVSSVLPLIDPAAGRYDAVPVVSAAQILFDRRDAIAFDGYKYITSTVDGREELYDLSADPHEQHSLVDRDGDRLDTGRRLLEDHLARAAALRKRLRIEEGALPSDEDTVRRLRTLGYLK